jgi:hypothetical protein
MITKIKRDTKYTSSIKKWKTVKVISYVVKIWVKNDRSYPKNDRS